MPRDQLSPSEIYRGNSGACWSDPKRYLPVCAPLARSGQCLCCPLLLSSRAPAQPSPPAPDVKGWKPPRLPE